MSLETLRNSIVTSIQGRRLGLDKDDFLVGIRGVRGTVGVVPELETVTSVGSTGTTIANYGHTFLNSSNASTWILPAPPYAGAKKTISSISTSTLDQTLDRSGTSFDIMSTEGTTMTTILFTGRGAAVELLARSTTRWDVINRQSTDLTAFNGST